MAGARTARSVAAVAVVQLCTHKRGGGGGQWLQVLRRAQLRGTRAPEPFMSVTVSNYATTPDDAASVHPLR